MRSLSNSNCIQICISFSQLEWREMIEQYNTHTLIRTTYSDLSSSMIGDYECDMTTFNGSIKVSLTWRECKLNLELQSHRIELKWVNYQLFESNNESTIHKRATMIDWADCVRNGGNKWKKYVISEAATANEGPIGFFSLNKINQLAQYTINGLLNSRSIYKLFFLFFFCAFVRFFLALSLPHFSILT